MVLIWQLPRGGLHAGWSTICAKNSFKFPNNHMFFLKDWVLSRCIQSTLREGS
jgi:hypothetical protein